MRITLRPGLGVFTIEEEKRYQIALTKTGKLQFYKVTPFTDLKALEERRRKYWEAVTAVYAYSKEEARAKAKKEFKGVRKDEIETR